MLIDNSVTGRTKVLGVIGNPIGHSISPQLHNTISRRLGIDAVYVPFKVEKNDLESAVKGLRALNVTGFNITIPYKNEVMKFIDENTRESLLVGAVNTVKNIDGRFYGYNTDAEGFSRSFKEEAGTGFKNNRVLIIGAGGTARAIAVKIAFEGAKKIFLINRTLSSACEIAEIVNSNIRDVVVTYSLEDDTAADVFKESDIIINTTPAGMYPDVDNSPLNNSFEFSDSQIVYDVIYNPVRTKLLVEAAAKGCKVINGLGMLFYQGIYAYEIWMGIRLPDDILKEMFESFVNILVN